MKYIVYCLPFFMLSCSNKSTKPEESIKIDSTWQQKVISDVVTIGLPDSSIFNENGVLKASFGKGRSGLYGVDYYDTIVAYIENEREFKTALKGYLSGKLGSSQLKSYDLTVTDTTIGNSTGYFIRGFSTDSLADCKYPFCYVTIANNKFYWFYACQPITGISNETRQFFHSIQFNREKFKEADYSLPPIHMRKESWSK